MFELKKATRSNVKLKIGFWGASGSGKTYSALSFAKGLVGDWGKIAIIDTENSSAELYSHLGEYMHLDFQPPFSPDRYIQAINFVKNNGQGIECLIIDSISHEWEGVGGCLEMVSNSNNKNSYAAWKDVTPKHNNFIQAILQAPFHVLVTGRSKPDFSMDKGDNGKTIIQKQGMKTITRDGFDYEMTIAFQIHHGNHFATIDKDRSNLFNDPIPFLITEDVGERVRKWNESGYVDYKEEFKKVGKQLFGNGADEWQYIKESLKYDGNNEDQDYWKKMVVKLKELKTKKNGEC